MRKKNVLADIFKYVEVKPNSPGSCWNWIGGLRGYGYGSFKINRETFQAHRLMYEITNGKIPEGKEIHHKCENTKCVNPFHLKAVSHLENMRLSRSAQKKHCIRGHELKRPNLIKRIGNTRQCKACTHLRWHANKEKRNGN